MSGNPQASREKRPNKNTPRRKRVNGKALAAVLGCLVLAAAAAALYIGLMPKVPGKGDHHSEEGRAYTHMSSPQEVEQYCGDLLCANLDWEDAVDGEVTLWYGENGLLDPSLHDVLTCGFDYEGGEWIYLSIYFPHCRSPVWPSEEKRTTIRGVEVFYTDTSGRRGISDEKYHGYVGSTFEGNIYHLEAYSDDREDVLLYYVDQLIPR